MTVFISYASKDSAFVDRLAPELLRLRYPIWLDRWKLGVGDSLLPRISQGIQSATAMIVVLSTHSVHSDWCQHELNAGLMRELEEKCVLVLPVLLENCDIPPTLGKKRHADFRQEFDIGFIQLRNSLAAISNDTQARVKSSAGNVDVSLDWKTPKRGKVSVAGYFLIQDYDKPFSTMAMVNIKCNERASRRHRELVQAGLEAYARQLVLTCAAYSLTETNVRVLLQNAEPVQQNFRFGDASAGLEFTCHVECRCLGEDTGFDVGLNLDRIVSDAFKGLERKLRIEQRLRHAAVEEQWTLKLILEKYRPDLFARTAC